MKGLGILVVFALMAVSQPVSATEIQRLEWYAVNYYAANVWCTGECIDNFEVAFDTEVTDEINLEIGGFVEVRGQYTRWRIETSTGASRYGMIGGVGYGIEENDGSTYQPLCEDVTGPFSDTMGVNFGVSHANGFFAGSDAFLMCGSAADGPNGFLPAEGEFGYWRESVYGAGWMLMGRADSLSVRVPEPGTLILLGLGLMGLGLVLRRSSK